MAILETLTDEGVTITKKRYKKLLFAEDFLSALEVAGVDNWSGYSYAWEIFREMREEEKD